VSVATKAPKMRADVDALSFASVRELGTLLRRRPASSFELATFFLATFFYERRDRAGRSAASPSRGRD
jgi:hypothetical protein